MSENRRRLAGDEHIDAAAKREVIHIKVFISADIEGTNGIAHWDEADSTKGAYGYFAQKMTSEVSAVCGGVNRAAPGCEIYIKDAHDSARNIDHAQLPENTYLNRNWARSPYSMMDGIDSSFSASIFTGYHSAAATNGNPLAHTMTDELIHVRLNGVYASECLLNYYSSLYNGVPLVMVAGDHALCCSIRELDPNIYTVATVTGRHGSTTSRHPNVVNGELAEVSAEAVKNAHRMSLVLPREFKAEIYFHAHYMAQRASYYPGAYIISDHTVGYDTDDYFEFLRFFMFVR